MNVERSWIRLASHPSFARFRKRMRPDNRMCKRGSLGYLYESSCKSVPLPFCLTKSVWRKLGSYGVLGRSRFRVWTYWIAVQRTFLQGHARGVAIAYYSKVSWNTRSRPVPGSLLGYINGQSHLQKDPIHESWPSEIPQLGELLIPPITSSNARRSVKHSRYLPWYKFVTLSVWMSGWCGDLL